MKHELVRQKVAEKVEAARKAGIPTLNLRKLADEILMENTTEEEWRTKRVQGVQYLVLEAAYDMGLFNKR